jgi:hypothetical protein
VPRRDGGRTRAGAPNVSPECQTIAWPGRAQPSAAERSPSGVRAATARIEPVMVEHANATYDACVGPTRARAPPLTSAVASSVARDLEGDGPYRSRRAAIRRRAATPSAPRATARGKGGRSRETALPSSGRQLVRSARSYVSNGTEGRAC